MAESASEPANESASEGRGDFWKRTTNLVNLDDSQMSSGGREVEERALVWSGLVLLVPILTLLLSKRLHFEEATILFEPVARPIS